VGRKTASVIGILGLVFFVSVWVLPKQVLSHHKARVLGDSTASSQIVFPPVTSGAGFFLPDSPLFFLDKTFQQIRLFLAFTPERRAKVREQIAGERLAELRIMLSRNNPNGISIALSNLTDETNQMAANISDSAANGRDVKLLAKSLNETIKTHRKILGILADQTDGVLRLQIKAAREALKEAKIEVEDELDEDELENEIEEGLDDEIDELADEATGSARRLEHAVDVLERLASEAAQKQQARREEALRHAIEVKNEALRKQQEKFLEEEHRKHKSLLHAREKAIEEAREAIKKSHEAVHKLKEAQEAVIEIKTHTDDDNSSSDFSNSGSLESSDNSGSGGSGDSGKSGKD
jgi:DNA repair exonuclease SbcCD ATPase subunit